MEILLTIIALLLMLCVSFNAFLSLKKFNFIALESNVDDDEEEEEKEYILPKFIGVKKSSCPIKDKITYKEYRNPSHKRGYNTKYKYKDKIDKSVRELKHSYLNEF